jgi:hypothetical protein
MHGTQTVDGRDWLPYQRGTFLTPACAEYVSGHSTFGAASAEILKRFTDILVFRVWRHAGARLVAYRAGADAPASDLLFWPTSSASADQAAVDAVGGIHFRDGDLEDRALGRHVAAFVWRKVQRLFCGPFGSTQGQAHRTPPQPTTTRS